MLTVYVLKNGVGRNNICFFKFLHEIFIFVSFSCRIRQYFCLCHTCAFPSASNLAHAQTLYRIGSLCRSRNMASSDANWFILKAYSRSNWFYFKRCQYSMFYTNCSWIFCIISYVNSIERMKYVAFWFSCIHKEFNVDPYNIHIFRDLQSEPIR
jgi:hypothetical protein